MSNRRILKKMLSFTTAALTCTNLMFAGNCGQLFSQEGLTVFAAETENTEISIDKTYLKVGETLKINNPTGSMIRCLADGSEVDPESFVLTEEFYEKWIEVQEFDGEGYETADKVYFSKLPVIYINTDDGQVPAFKKDAKSGEMFIQNNEETAEPLYNGKMTMQGRGNTTWGWEKKPYKIKLDKKTDLYGMGKSKKWCLLANYQDESLLRNTTASKLSKELGLTTMETVWTDVVINGEYVGNYQLCEQVGIEEARVDIFDWEGEAKDAASAIAKKEKIKGDKKDELTDMMTEDMSWIKEGGTVTFDGKEYLVSDYYDFESDISGGYLFESSEEYDEESKFMTDSGLKVMLKSPEFLASNDAMMSYVQDYWQNFENAYRSEDGYTEIDGKMTHYTELADFDSMVSYWLLMEIMGNDDSRYKSRYIYKPHDSLLKFGPPWDFDTGAGSIIVSQEISSDATGWKVSQFEDPQNFYREFLDDPLFISAATDRYWQIRPYLEDVIKENGALERDSEYLYESGMADSALWDRNNQWPGYGRGYIADRDLFISYMRERIAWLDEQFSSDDALLASTYNENSASPYIRSDAVYISTPNAVDDTISASASAEAVIKPEKDLIMQIAVNDPQTTSLKVYVNGLYYDTFALSSGSVRFELPANKLSQTAEKKNVISFIGKDKDNNTTVRNFTTVKQSEYAAEPVPEFKSQSIVLSRQISFNFYLDITSLTEEEKNNSYMEFNINGKTYTDAFDADHMNCDGKYYGFTCSPDSFAISNRITAIYHYGDDKTITNTFSVPDYINTIIRNTYNRYNERIIAVIRSLLGLRNYFCPPRQNNSIFRTWY